MNRHTPHIGATLAQRRAMVDKSALATKLSRDLNTLRYEQQRSDEINARLQVDALLLSIRENDTAGCWVDPAPNPEPFGWVDGAYFLTCMALTVGALWMLRLGGVL